jgi:hypothetical protein
MVILPDQITAHTTNAGAYVYWRVLLISYWLLLDIIAFRMKITTKFL